MGVLESLIATVGPPHQATSRQCKREGNVQPHSYSRNTVTPDHNEGLLQRPPHHPLPELLQNTIDMAQDDWQQETPSDELS
ncbi:hypothetical protein AALO_G00052640 [Alosa alosa]|uniref:Uncharacterized protein n=1 Tax=Alosa alosa TaxID=278164 RepID=A0AAV6H7N7_9TELE|nr:hypothetical protein AALO_G00052640 [Alosa alosa]